MRLDVIDMLSWWCMADSSSPCQDNRRKGRLTGFAVVCATVWHLGRWSDARGNVWSWGEAAKAGFTFSATAMQQYTEQ